MENYFLSQHLQFRGAKVLCTFATHAVDNVMRAGRAKAGRAVRALTRLTTLAKRLAGGTHCGIARSALAPVFIAHVILSERQLCFHPAPAVSTKPDHLRSEASAGNSAPQLLQLELLSLQLTLLSLDPRH